MKLQNMLLPPSISTSVCAEEKRINEYTSPNLPPIQKSNLNRRYTGTSYINDDFLILLFKKNERELRSISG